VNKFCAKKRRKRKTIHGTMEQASGWALNFTKARGQVGWPLNLLKLRGQVGHGVTLNLGTLVMPC
jgi:hypothetical protein